MLSVGSITKQELIDVLKAIGAEDPKKMADVIFFYVSMNRLTDGFLEALGEVSS